ncbi:MAG TPA: aminoglycoside adenylyltransferase domain-containing protein [Streptosporangiaceae bacterium]|nr:aminoglycoside adenylyltransferase domain-containing protein [Streptosporangiaceae bacterium]
MPDRVLAYAAAVTEALTAASGGSLHASYLHGSAVLGGWQPGSDVDMLFVAADNASGSTLKRMAAVLADRSDQAGGCPGRGLECSIVTATAAATPSAPWPYLLHAVAEPGGCLIQDGADTPGDPDLLMHYAVCRAAGHALTGSPPRDIIGPVPRQAILGYLADELDWGLGHATEAYAVLNACRALVFLADDAIVSKIAGGDAALDRGFGPAELIMRALSQQRGCAGVQQPEADAAEFVLAAAGALREACGLNCPP